MQKLFLLWMCCLVLLSGCQLSTANYFRDEVFPKETWPKVALSPVLLPTYAVLSVCDVVLVNPVRGCANIPKNASTIWNWQNDSTAGTFLIPVKVIAIPPSALGTAIFSEQFIYQDQPSSAKRFP